MSTTEPHAADSAESGGYSPMRRAAIALTRPIAFVGVIGMLLASGVTVLDVLLRWLASTGVTALNEIVSMTFAVAVAACIPAGLASGVGVTIDVIEKQLSPRSAASLRALGAVALLVAFAVLTWRMGIFAESLRMQGRTTVILTLPQAPFIWTTTVLLGASTFVQAIAAWDHVRMASAARRAPWTRLDRIVWPCVALFALACVYVALNWTRVSYLAQDYPATTVIIGFLLMWILLLALIPLAAVLALSGLAGAGLLIGWGPAMSAYATEAAGFLTNYQVATLPLFLMMGSFAAVAGVSDDVYRLAQAALGRFRGGLAMATIGGCAGFGAVTGSSLATVATFGRVSLPQMEARKYAPHFAAGCVAAGGTLGALIPPSGPLVIFALLTEASIGQLFVAAIVPGLIATAFYIATIAIIVRRDPDAAPPAGKVPAGELAAALRNCGSVVALFGAVIGGMYTGVFTATEAAAVGAFGAFFIALVRGKLSRDRFWAVMSETTASTALIYSLIFGVLIFSFFVGVSALPERATAFVGNLALPAIVILLVILAVYLFLGCIMDSFTVMIVTVPIMTPVILSMGYDMVWWGVINLVIVETGLITPPFGLHLFLLKSMLPNTPLERIYRGVLPFCIADFIKLALMIVFPALTLWLPSSMAK